MQSSIVNLHQNHTECRLSKGMVKGISDNTVLVDGATGLINASIAFSCLVSPIAGDTVLISGDGSDFFVLAVLTRSQQQDMTLDFPGDVQMTSSTGTVGIAARESINLTSSGNTNLSSANLNLASVNLNVNSGQVKSHSQKIDVNTQQVKLTTQVLSTIAKQVSLHAEVAVRWVEKVETLNIGNLIQNIRKNYTSHSKQAVITAKKDIRIDGERIHMG